MSVPAFMTLIDKAIDRGLTAAAIALEGTIRAGMGRGHGGVRSAPGDFPNSQFGDLRNSFGYVPGQNGVAYVGSGSKVARWLNDGVTIRPRGKALAIPLTREAERMMRNAGGRARSVINALKFDKGRPITFARTRNGLLILRKASRAKKAPAEPFILLTSKPSVILPRPWARLGIQRGTPAMVDAFTRAARIEAVA